MTRVLVTDASVIVDLLARFAAEPIETVLFDSRCTLAAPELLDVEVLNTLRKLETREAVPPSRHAALLGDFRALPIRRYRHAPLWQDIWRLRQNLTAYDACYVALAIQLDATLVTRDERIAGAPGLAIPVEVV
jgi:predicted nucleic acid-binding protein